MRKYWDDRHIKLLHRKGNMGEQAKTHRRLQASPRTHCPLSGAWTSRLLALNHRFPSFIFLFCILFFPLSTLSLIPCVFPCQSVKQHELLGNMQINVCGKKQMFCWPQSLAALVDRNNDYYNQLELSFLFFLHVKMILQLLWELNHCISYFWKCQTFVVFSLSSFRMQVYWINSNKVNMRGCICPVWLCEIILASDILWTKLLYINRERNCRINWWRK